MTMNVLRPLSRLATGTLGSVVLAASMVAVSAAQAADKPARPTEVRGVKLTSICIDCGVVSDVRKDTVAKGKGSKAAVDEAAASAASAGAQGGKTVTVWTTIVVFKNGTTQTYQQKRNPGLHPGDVVTIQEGIPRKYVP